MKSRKPEVERLSTHYDANEERLLEDYFAFLRFKSISSEKENRQEMLDCADWLKRYLEGMDFQVEIWEGPGHPVVYARNTSAGPDKPTVLIYNHYDVQPVDPLELWESPPFEPVVRDGSVYARGAQDNKGQAFFVIAALKSLLDLDGRLPVNVKLCLDGEEESGSTVLGNLLEKKREALSANHMIIADLGMGNQNKPSISLGVRGIASMTLVVTGSKTDFHSGTHGGIVYNPNHALVEMLAKLRDDSGRVAVPGFYDDVEEAPAEIRGKLKASFNAERYQAAFGAKPTGGEKDYTPLESGTTRPTLEINGLGGGYAGDGFKTVIPAKAVAKISCRLVPNQDPDRISRLIQDFILSIVPEGVEAAFPPEGQLEGGLAVRSDSESAVVKALAQAYQEISGRPTGFELAGVSVPIVSTLKAAIEAEVVLMGWGLGTDNVHAPNECFGLDRLKKGFVSIARALEILGG